MIDRVRAGLAARDVGRALGEGAVHEHLVEALEIGWAHADRWQRRDASLPLGFGAVVIAEVAAWALDGRPLNHLLAETAEGYAWPSRGVGRRDREVVGCSLWLCHRFDEAPDALRSALRCGGPTASIAALTCGVLGCYAPQAAGRIAGIDLDAAVPRARELVAGRVSSR